MARYGHSTTSFPRLDVTRNHDEQGMGHDLTGAAEAPEPLGITPPQFLLQVLILKPQLTLGHVERHPLSLPGNLGGVEGVASAGCLIVDSPEVRRNGCQGLA